MAIGPSAQPSLPDVFRTGSARFISGAPLQAGIAAILRHDAVGEMPNHWQEYQSQGPTVPTYVHQNSRGKGTILVQPGKQIPGRNGDLLGGEVGWHLVREVGVETARIHLVLAAHAMEQRQPTSDPFLIVDHKLAEYMGYSGRSRVHKNLAVPDVLQRMRKEVALASAWFITIQEWQAFETRGHRRQKLVLRELDPTPLWEIAEERTYQGYLEVAGLQPDLRSVAWVVRPGLWAARFLTREGMMQWGSMARAVLQIDANHYPLAAKLAVYLTLQARIKLPLGQPLSYRARTLLDVLGESPESGQGASNVAVRQARHRKRDALHHAVELLLPDKGITDGGPLGTGYQWVTEPLRSLSPDDNAGRQKLRWPDWLEQQVRFWMPEDQSKTYVHMGVERRRWLKGPPGRR